MAVGFICTVHNVATLSKEITPLHVVLGKKNSKIIDQTINLPPLPPIPFRFHPVPVDKISPYP